MTVTGYTILAYALALALLWGYAATLWLRLRRARGYNALRGGAQTARGL